MQANEMLGGALLAAAGPRAAKRRPPKAGLAPPPQRPRFATFKETVESWRSKADVEDWGQRNPLRPNAITHQAVVRDLVAQAYLTKFHEGTKEIPDEMFQQRHTGWRSLHKPEILVTDMRGNVLQLSEAEEAIAGAEAAALKLVPHVQAMADYTCAFKDAIESAEREFEAADLAAAKILNPFPILNPADSVDGVPPSELPKDHPEKWVSAGSLPEDHPSKYLNVQDYYSTPWVYGGLRATIAHAEHPETIARLRTFSEERGWGSHALAYGEVAMPPTLIAAPPRLGKSTPTDMMVWFARRLGMTVTYGCAPHTTIVCREFKERYEKLGWWNSPVLGECTSLAEISCGKDGNDAEDAAARCEAHLKAKSYDFVLYSSENASHCQAVRADVDARRVLLETEVEGGAASIVDDPNHTAVFCNFHDEAQNFARFGAEDAKKKYEKKLRELHEAQQKHNAAHAAREAGHAVTAQHLRCLKALVTALVDKTKNAKTEYENKLRACQEHLRPTFVSSRGYQVLISATLLPTLQERQLYGTLFCKLSKRNALENAILEVGAERYLLPPIQPAGIGSYVGVQQMVCAKYSEASGYTRHKVRTRTIRLLEENFDHQINQLNAWIEAIEENISKYQDDNRKRWQRAFHNNEHPMPLLRPDNDPVFETMRAKCRALQASIAEATQRKAAFRGGTLVPDINNVMWRESYLKDKDLLRLDGGGLFSPKEHTHGFDPKKDDVPKDVCTAEPRWPDLPRVRKVAQAARGLVWIESALGGMGPHSKLLDSIEDVPENQPLRLPMTIVCPHSETNRTNHTKANTQLDWAYQIARANVRKQQNSLIAIYASGLNSKKIACSFPGVAVLANDNAKDNKHSDADRQVTVIETGRTATGAWAIKPIQRAVSNMDGVVDMLKTNGSRLEDMATFNLYVVGYEMFNGALTLSRFTSADVGVTDANGVWQQTGTRTVHLLPNRVLFAHTGTRCIDSIYQIAGRACNDMPYEVEHRIEVLSGQHTVCNTKAYALAEVQWVETLARRPAGAKDAYSQYADALERQRVLQQENPDGMAVDYDGDGEMDAQAEDDDEDDDDPNEVVKPPMSLNYARAAYCKASGLIDDESLSAFSLDDLSMGRKKLKAGATFGSGETLTDDQLDQLQRQVNESSTFKAERWADGRPAPAPAAPAAPAAAAPQPDAQGYYATSLVEFKQLYRDLLPRHIRDNGEHYADSVIRDYLAAIDHTFVEHDRYYSDRIGADNNFEVAAGMEHKLCFPDDLPNGANDPRWHGPNAHLRLRLNSDVNNNRHTSGVVATYKVFKHLLPNEGDPLTRIFKSSRRAAPAVGAHVGVDAE